MKPWANIRSKLSPERQAQLDADIQAELKKIRDPLLSPKAGDVWVVRNHYIMVDMVDEEADAIGYVSSDNVISDWHSLTDFAKTMLDNGQFVMSGEDMQMPNNLNEKGAVAFLQSCVCAKRF